MKKNFLLIFLMAWVLFSCDKEEKLVVPAPEFTIPDEFYTTEEYVTIKDVSEADGYHWDFGNGTTSTQREPDSFTYTEPGAYTITLTTYTAGVAKTTEKEVKVARLYAYEVQLLSYFENYALEGGDTGAPSEGNPDVYLQVSAIENNKEQVIFKSDVRPAVTREDLPLTFAVDRILLGRPYSPYTFEPFFKFFDQTEDKADRLIAHNIVAGGSSHFYLDKAAKEGYYTQQRGNDNWGSHILVKFKAELP
ncbi:PKD domain-containing protein [Pontibacter anaerobius]|uniref:PKD domain-containing protein n=1 Tax=Pontibacter anaerobius TaxID=2993940 RepID=A0ABT3RG70_9BACT|nr:PKD domain-containing protein [Pontibacter anaerobius]MCX2740436.1 PKD domain-containing protein [Pontibacter anaerobius]